MAKVPSPLLGFNNNVKHKGRVFHIQTEDSGIRHPHIITHLFADGGRILKTIKTSYAEYIGQDAMAELVRNLMKEQHKAMFTALRDGQYDQLIDESFGARHGASAAMKAQPPPPEPPRVEPVAPPPVVPVAPVAVAPPVSDNGRDAPPPSRRAALRPKFDLDPTTILAPAERNVAASGAEVISASATTTGKSQPAVADVSNIDLDLEALERAAAEAESPFYQQIQDLPPPPNAVLGGRPRTGSFRSSVSPEPPNVRQSTGTSSQPPAARYAASRPAGVFSSATSRPQEGTTIFGEDLISEKSLDEVILSYLAEDLDPSVPKK